MSNPLSLWRNRNLSSWRDFDDAFRSMEKMFSGTAASEVNFTPSCEVSETNTHYLVKFDVPGLKKEEFKIDLHDNLLTVSGERKIERKEDTKQSFFSEISYGSFMRSFTLPTKVDPEKVDARYEDGVLNLSIPKTEPAKARQITVR